MYIHSIRYRNWFPKWKSRQQRQYNDLVFNIFRNMPRKFPVLKIAQASSLQSLIHTRLRQIHKKIIFKFNFVQECMDTDSSILSKINFFEVLVKLEFTLIEIYQYR